MPKKHTQNQTEINEMPSKMTASKIKEKTNGSFPEFFQKISQKWSQDKGRGEIPNLMFFSDLDAFGAPGASRGAPK